MALGSTVYQIEVELADVDRGVYDSLAVRVACHPSESGPYLVTRLLAFALEYSEDLAFSRGLAASDEPALWRHDLTGQLLSWIEIGTPDGARLHKARKAADDVAVYCHKDPAAWLRALSGTKVHQADSVRLFALGPHEVQLLADAMERRCAWSVTRNEGELYVETDALSLSVPLTRLDWP